MKVLKKFSSYKKGGKTDEGKKNGKSSLPENTIFTGEKEKQFHHPYSGRPTADATKIEVEKIIIDGKEYWYSSQYDKKIPVNKMKDFQPFPGSDKDEDKKGNFLDQFRRLPFEKNKNKKKPTEEENKKKEEFMKKFMLKGGGTLMERYNKKLKGK